MATGKYTRRIYRKWLKEDFPEYENIHDYLVEVMYAMQPEPGDDFKILVIDPDEPRLIQITHVITYTD